LEIGNFDNFIELKSTPQTQDPFLKRLFQQKLKNIN